MVSERERAWLINFEQIILRTPRELIYASRRGLPQDYFLAGSQVGGCIIYNTT